MGFRERFIPSRKGAIEGAIQNSSRSKQVLDDESGARAKAALYATLAGPKNVVDSVVVGIYSFVLEEDSVHEHIPEREADVRNAFTNASAITLRRRDFEMATEVISNLPVPTDVSEDQRTAVLTALQTRKNQMKKEKDKVIARRKRTQINKMINRKLPFLRPSGRATVRTVAWLNAVYNTTAILSESYSGHHVSLDRPLELLPSAAVAAFEVSQKIKLHKKTKK